MRASIILLSRTKNYASNISCFTFIINSAKADECIEIESAFEKPSHELYTRKLWPIMIFNSLTKEMLKIVRIHTEFKKKEKGH